MIRLFVLSLKNVSLCTVRPPPLNWTVHKTGDKFNITWSPPEIGNLSEWTFSIKYTECNENKVRDTTIQNVDICCVFSLFIYIRI